jgi:site-specific DNA-methyltransferase (adenine-specific)
MELYNDDCLKKMKDIETNSIDLLFCDLPYGETACKWDCLIDLDEFWKQVNRICKDTTPMFFTCSTKFGVSLINSNPKNFRYDLVWVKSAPCGFLNAKKMPMKKHEMIYVFYKKLPLYDLSSHSHKFLKNKEESYSTNTVYSDKKGKPREVYRAEEGKYDPPLPTSVVKEELPLRHRHIKKCIYGGGQLDIIDIDNKSKPLYDPPLPNSILEVASEKKKHPTQKPVGLIEFCLKYYSKEGDKVLDPTMGSGSTGVACKKMNRHFIGIEMDKEIYDKAVERLNK